MSLKDADNLLLYIGEYDNLDDANADYEAVKALHSVEIIGTYDAAVVAKDDTGKPKIVHHTEKPTQHGGWGGLAVGAAIGVVFPPAVIGSALAGAAVGGVGGHLKGGIPRGDLKDLAATLEEGQASLIVIAEPTLEKAIEEATKRAKRQMKKEIEASAKELEKEIDAIPAS